MRTPGHDQELAAGFLFSEGIIKRREDLTEIGYCKLANPDDAPNIINAFLGRGATIDWKHLQRFTFASSSCGVCGKSSIDSVHQHFPPIPPGRVFQASLLPELPARLREAQVAFDQTGGLHGAALFDFSGKLLAAREDVGRHNAVDKIIGWGFLDHRLPFSECLLLVSGRASFEIVQKALAAGVPIIAAVSAPSSLAVELAVESGQGLVGFLRDGRMNVYAGKERLDLQK